MKPQQLVTGKLEPKKMRAIEIALKWGPRNWGLVLSQDQRPESICIYIFTISFRTSVLEDEVAAITRKISRTEVRDPSEETVLIGEDPARYSWERSPSLEKLKVVRLWFLDNY